MHEQERRQLEGHEHGSRGRRPLRPEHPLHSLQRTAGNAAVAGLVEGTIAQRQMLPGGEMPGAGVVNLMAGVVNVMGGVVNVSGGGSPGGGEGGVPSGGGGGAPSGGGGGWGEEIPVPATGGV